MSGFGLDPVPGMDEAVIAASAPAQTPRTIGLKLINGPKSGAVFSSALQTAVIGRTDPPSINVDIDLTAAELGDPPMISRKHARLEKDTATGDTYLVDLGSTNGTWVDGVKLETGRPSAILTVPIRLRLANLEFDTTYVD